MQVFDFLQCGRNFVKYEGSKDILAVNVSPSVKVPPPKRLQDLTSNSDV